MVTLRAAAILALVVAILVMVAWVLKRAGLFEPIVTKTTILGPYMVVYDHYTVGVTIKGFSAQHKSQRTDQSMSLSTCRAPTPKFLRHLASSSLRS
jgi:hypothetical protein